MLVPIYASSSANTPWDAEQSKVNSLNYIKKKELDNY